jgi:uncharacterized repeat protein (TIGR02543 family)
MTTATDGAQIWYTLDGTDPTSSSTLYSDAFTVSANTTVKAITLKDGYWDSAIVSAYFEILGSSGLSVEKSTNYSVSIQLPSGWEGETVASNEEGTVTAVVTPSPSDGEVTYSWYLDGSVAKNNSDLDASTGSSIIFGTGEEEVTLGSGPHLLTLKVSKGSMTFSDQKLISASLVGISYDVTFDAQGGSDLSPLETTVTNGSPYGTLATTTKAGYFFAGWYTEADGEGTRITEETTVTIGANQKLYAAWKILAVGAIGPAGGYVFYENPDYEADGWQYLEAAPSDILVGDSDYEHIFGYYKKSGVSTLVGTNTGIGTGQANTTALVAAMRSTAYTSDDKYLTTADYAARMCDTLVIGDYDDWFLPSINELGEMYTYIKTLGGFANDAYWSSSEHNATFAFFWGFTGGYATYNVKADENRVRPVRAF